MKMQEIAISDFSKGMAEIVELGQSFNQEYGMTAVKYLENLNPNMILSALVKRKNYVGFMLGVDGVTLLPNDEPYSNSVLLDYAGMKYSTPMFPHKYTKVDVPDPDDPSTPFSAYIDMRTGIEVQPDYRYNLGNAEGSQFLIGMGRFDMRNPYADSVYFALVRDDQIINNKTYKSTSVNGFYPSKTFSAGPNQKVWCNPLYDAAYYVMQNSPPYASTPVYFPNKGKRINGIVQDWVAVGQALYLVSMPDLIDSDLPAYPVYRWAPILENDSTFYPTVFTQTQAPRSYYLLQNDSQMNVKASSIVTPYANKNTNLREETITWDGVKDSIDVLWWQTDKLPDMADINEPSLALLGADNTYETTSNRETRIKSSYATIADMRASYKHARQVTDYINSFQRILLTNLPSSLNEENKAVSEYFCIYMPEMNGKYKDFSFMPDSPQDLSVHVTTDGARLSTYIGTTSYAPFAGWSKPSREIQEAVKPRPVEYGTEEDPQLTALKKLPLKLILQPTSFENWYVYFYPRYFRFAYDEPEYVYWVMEDGSEIKKKWSEYPFYGRYVAEFTLDNYEFWYDFAWFMPKTIADLKKSKNFPKSFILDYEAADAPRVWAQGDKIPYVLTAMVNGTETIVLQSEYLVGEGDLDAILKEEGLYEYKDIYLDGYVPIGKRPVKENQGLALYDYRAETHQNAAPFVCFTLRLNIPYDVDVTAFLPIGLTSFRLYVSMPNPSSSAFFATDSNAESVSLVGSYTFPMVSNKDSRAYGLVKEFLVKPDENLQRDGIDIAFKDFGTGSQGTTALAHGKWVKWPNAPADNPFGAQFTDKGGSGYYYVPYLGTFFDTRPTPDFYLWDYSSGPAITDNLGVLAVAWDGIGARCITQISNRVVIAGTIDKNKSEEIGRIRAAAVQTTVVANTLFAELDFLDVASTAIEALANFRNDLWVFSRNSVVRIAADNPYDIATWRIVDTITGQGLANKKHLAQTPHGLYYANSTGIWFANGSDIENISTIVNQTYHFLYNQSADWQSYNKYALSGNKIGAPNPTMELNYDPYNNEVVMSVRAVREADNLVGMPYGSLSLHLIYNVENKNWRVETFDLPENTPNGIPFAHSQECRLRFVDTDSKLVIPIIFRKGSVTWVKQGNGEYDEYQLNYVYDAIEARLRPAIEQPNARKADVVANMYAGIVTLYEVGNGLDDSLLRQVLVEVTPIEHQFNSVITGEVPDPINWRDPKLWIQMRNKESRMLTATKQAALPFPTLAAMYDLVELNTRTIAPSDIYWSHVNTPVARVWSRESIVLNTPLDSKFRRFEPTFCTTSLTYLKGFRFRFATYGRKTYA